VELQQEPESGTALRRLRQAIWPVRGEAPCGLLFVEAAGTGIELVQGVLARQRVPKDWGCR
jgi:hypothetical protein